MTVLSVLLSISLSPVILILRILSTLLLPVTVIARHVLYFLVFFFYLPFALLARLEAIYIFCGTAAIIGMIAGVLLGFTSHIFSGALGLYQETESIAPSNLGRSKKRTSSQGYRSPIPVKQQAHTPMARMLFPPSIPTILEEEDEDSPILPGNRRRRGKAGNNVEAWFNGSDESSDL
ncbi:hypothetical protein DFP73DRAFT_535128 [Morchella snyderi]|nr:hypothetical protein DFP73DRAFT_535128 [Morchella snyderi]